MYIYRYDVYKYLIKGLKRTFHNSDEVCRVDNVELLEVLLVPEHDGGREGRNTCTNSTHNHRATSVA